MKKADRQEIPTIYIDRYRIAALERLKSAHIDRSSGYQLDTGSKVGDRVWVYPDTPPHIGLLCIIEKIDVKRTKRKDTFIKATIGADIS